MKVPAQRNLPCGQGWSPYNDAGIKAMPFPFKDLLMSTFWHATLSCKFLWVWESPGRDPIKKKALSFPLNPISLKPEAWIVQRKYGDRDECREFWSPWLISGSEEACGCWWYEGWAAAVAMKTASVVKETMTQWHLLKMPRETLFRGPILMDVGTTAMESHSGGERLDSALGTAHASGNL